MLLENCPECQTRFKTSSLSRENDVCPKCGWTSKQIEGKKKTKVEINISIDKNSLKFPLAFLSKITDKTNRINNCFARFNDLEKGIILTIAVVAPVVFNLAQRHLEAIAWEEKVAECEAWNQKIKNSSYHMLDFYFEQKSQCMRELGQMRYRGKVFD